MDNEDWEHVVTLLQDEMRHTPADCILFCRDPLGAVHASAVDNKGGENAKCSEVPVTKTSLGVRQYRKNYEEFWYILGDVALSEGERNNDVKINIYYYLYCFSFNIIVPNQ